MVDKVRAYEMKMLFSASVGLREINDILWQTGCNDTLQVKDAISVSIEQTVPFVPSEEYLQKVAEAIKDNYSTRDINITECHFTGYEYIREVEIGGTNDGE